MATTQVDRRSIWRRVILSTLAGALLCSAVATAQVTTTASVCGNVTAFTAATLTSPGSITIGGQTIAIAANTTVDGSGLIRVGTDLCLNGTLNLLGQLV